jgi:hypothetical protein
VFFSITFISVGRGSLLLTETGKKMAQAKAKTSKAVSNFDGVDVEIAREFSAIPSGSLEAELAVWLKMVGKISAGLLTVKGAKATIQKVEEIGSLPSVASSSAQYSLQALAVRNLSGGETQALKTVINVAVQGMRKLKKDLFAEKMGEAKSFAQFAKVVEDAPKPTRTTSNTSDATDEDGEITADSVIALAFGLWVELDDLTIHEIEKAEKFANALAVALTNSKRGLAKSIEAHPAKAIA